DERRALAETGRRHALSFRWDATADALLALCRELAPAGEVSAAGGETPTPAGEIATPAGEVPAPVPVVPDATAVPALVRPQAADVTPLSTAREARRRQRDGLPGPAFRRRRGRQDRAAAPEPRTDTHEEPA